MGVRVWGLGVRVWGVGFRRGAGGLGFGGNFLVWASREALVVPDRLRVLGILAISLIAWVIGVFVSSTMSFIFGVWRKRVPYRMSWTTCCTGIGAGASAPDSLGGAMAALAAHEADQR